MARSETTIPAATTLLRPGVLFWELVTVFSPDELFQVIERKSGSAHWPIVYALLIRTASGRVNTDCGAE
jgi:hypothetical protein